MNRIKKVRCLDLLIVTIILCYTICCNNNSVLSSACAYVEENEKTLTDQQRAIIVTADAYWRRGVNLQYEPRLKYYRSPEEATEDNVQYGT